MSAETRPFVLLFAMVIITVTIVANAEPVPVPVALITKEDAINYFKKKIKSIVQKNIYEPAKKQLMPIVTAVTNTFAEGLKNATSTAIIKGRDAFVKMKSVREMQQEETTTDYPYF